MNRTEGKNAVVVTPNDKIEINNEKPKASAKEKSKPTRFPNALKMPTVTAWDKLKAQLSTLFSLKTSWVARTHTDEVASKLKGVLIKRELRFEKIAAKKMELDDKSLQKTLREMQDQIKKDKENKPNVPEQITKKHLFGFINEKTAGNMKTALSVTIDSYLNALHELSPKQAMEELNSLFKVSVERITASQMQLVDLTELAEIADQFSSEGRHEKASITKQLLEELKVAKSPEGSLKLYKAEAEKLVKDEIKSQIESINEGKNQATFLRGNTSPSLSHILFAHGLETTVETFRKVISDIDKLPEFKEAVKGLHQMIDGAKEKKYAPSDIEKLSSNPALTSQIMTKDGLSKILKLAEAVFSKFKDISPDPRVIDLLKSFSAPISEALKDNKLGENGEATANRMLRQFYNNNIVLRAIVPAFSITTSDNRDHVTVIKLLGQVLQKIANENDLGHNSINVENISQKKDLSEVKDAFDQGVSRIKEQIDLIFVDQYKMQKLTAVDLQNGKVDIFEEEQIVQDRIEDN